MCSLVDVNVRPEATLTYGVSHIFVSSLIFIQEQVAAMSELVNRLRAPYSADNFENPGVWMCDVECVMLGV